MTLEESRQDALMSKHSSRRNKLWLVGWYVAEGRFVEWRWEGEPYRSRLCFRFAPDGNFRPSKSYEDDVYPHLLWV
jgi:hypothetical protein